MIMKNPSIAGRLSKRFLLGLPEGVCLVSNVMDAPGQPMLPKPSGPTPTAKPSGTPPWPPVPITASATSSKNPADYLALSLGITYARERN